VLADLRTTSSLQGHINYPVHAETTRLYHLFAASLPRTDTSLSPTDSPLYLTSASLRSLWTVTLLVFASHQATLATVLCCLVTITLAMKTGTSAASLPVGYVDTTLGPAVQACELALLVYRTGFLEHHSRTLFRMHGTRCTLRQRSHTFLCGIKTPIRPEFLR
jgi:hypothetical protein